MRIILLSALLFLSLSLLSAEIVPLQEGPIHEAFVTQEYGQVIGKSRLDKPPPPIKEKVSESPKEGMEWLSGYWEYSPKWGDFIWVSGVWRTPPPNHQWVAGRWIEENGYWLRLPGFWSRQSEEALFLVPQTPPDSIDEPLPPPPAANYFWILGHWAFDPSSARFEWHKGRWQTFDSHWVYTPAHYLWRPKGYLFIEGYWDWPLEGRGIPYAAVIIPEELRGEPYQAIEELPLAAVIINLFPLWPNYLYFFHTFYYYNPDFWREWGVELPWWSWQEWWALPWKEQMALWWWWSHPNYPQPAWLTATLAHKIVPPSKGVLNMMAREREFLNITSGGVVGDQLILERLDKMRGYSGTVIPYSFQESLQSAITPREAGSILLPDADVPPGEEIKKPFFGPTMESLERATKRIPIHHAPALESEPIEPPKIKKSKRSPSPFPHSNVDKEKLSWPKRREKMPPFPHSNSGGESFPEEVKEEKVIIKPQILG